MAQSNPLLFLPPFLQLFLCLWSSVTFTSISVSSLEGSWPCSATSEVSSPEAPSAALALLILLCGQSPLPIKWCLYSLSHCHTVKSVDGEENHFVLLPKQPSCISFVLPLQEFLWRGSYWGPVLPSLTKNKDSFLSLPCCNSFVCSGRPFSMYKFLL